MSSSLNLINEMLAMKLDNANQDATLAAHSARGNIKDQKKVRAALRQFEDYVRSDNDGNGKAEITSQELRQIHDIRHRAGVDYTYLTAGEIGIEGDAETRADAVDALRSSFQDRIKDLEDNDKLTNFDIQDLSTRVTQLMNAQSTLTKKMTQADDRIQSNWT